MHSILHRESPWVSLATVFVTVSFSMMLYADTIGEFWHVGVVAAGVLLLASTCLAIKMAQRLGDDTVYPVYRAFELGIPVITFWVLIGHGLAYKFADDKFDVPPQNTNTWFWMLFFFVWPFLAVRCSPTVRRWIEQWTETIIGKCIFFLILSLMLYLTSFLNALQELH